MPEPRWTGTNELESPCYDRKTKTDCPRRCGGCQVDCPEWKAYCEERQKIYDKRAIESDVHAIMLEHSGDAYFKHVKKKQRMRRYYR